MTKLTIQQQRAAIRAEFPRLLGRYKDASRVAKFTVIILAGVTGVAQFAHFPTQSPLDFWNWAGILASVGALVAGTMILIQEPDAAENLIKAHDAVETAAEERAAAAEGLRQVADIERVAGDETRRLVHLYSAIDGMRTYLDECLEVARTAKDSDVIRGMLETSARSIILSHGFDTKQDYTICVYRADDDAATKRKLLVCCADLRAIPCDPKEARRWKEGVGIAGAAFSREDEIVLADLTSPELRTYYDLQSQARKTDLVKYRSIIAIPIWADGSDTDPPWGVAVATTDQPHHFTPDNRRNGDGARALAAMVGFALKLQKYRPPAPEDASKNQAKA